MERCDMKKFAFTLAEVLIVLGIIGVVAAMTIPTLINNYQVSQYESALKHTYSTLIAGFKQIELNNDCDSLSCTGIFNNNASTDTDFNNNLDVAVKKAFKVLHTYKT